MSHGYYKTYGIGMIFVSDTAIRRQVRVVYNSVFRRIFHYRSWQSVRELQSFLSRPNWEELLESRTISFTQHLCDDHFLRRLFFDDCHHLAFLYLCLMTDINNQFAFLHLCFHVLYCATVFRNATCFLVNILIIRYYMRAGGQGPYLRSPGHLGRSSRVKK